MRLRDQIIVVVLATLALAALVFWFGALYVAATKPVPAQGGHYAEGVVAQPRYINPILAQTSDADADLVELIYSGLFDYDATGKIEKRLASDYSLSDDGLTYTVFLKPGVLFQDGQELTADDVIFTIQAIQDPAYKSPLNANWVGVKVNSLDRYTVVFTLERPYFGFLENLTVGILPKHIWENIAPDRFSLADYNLLQPVGTGPYMFSDIDKDSSGNVLSYHLQAFQQYFQGIPHIDRITLRFYPDEETMIEAFNKGEIQGMHSVSPKNMDRLSTKKKVDIRELALPRVFSVFLNTNKSTPLAYDEVRKALNLATDREAVIKAVLQGYGVPATGPFLPFMFGYDAGATTIPFDKGQANQLLDQAGWSKEEDGIRVKNGTRLAFELSTPDWPELTETADLLRDEWRDIGAAVDVKVLSTADLKQNLIRPRQYQALLFGEGSMLDPDPYFFWHSSQKNDPGFNYAFFDNKRVDDITASARRLSDPAERAKQYSEFQQIITSENPAVFLYSPLYLYVVSSDVQGIGVESLNAPSSRFAHVADWYMKTKRVRK